MNTIEITKLEIELKYKKKMIKLYGRYIKKLDKIIREMKK